MVLVILSNVIIYLGSIILLIFFELKVVSVVLLVIGLLLTKFIFRHYRTEKKYYIELVRKFDDKLVSQVNEVINRRVAIELQIADEIRQENKVSLEKMIGETQEFDNTTSIVNGGDTFVELRLVLGRYTSEFEKENYNKYVI